MKSPTHVASCVLALLVVGVCVLSELCLVTRLREWLSSFSVPYLVISISMSKIASVPQMLTAITVTKRKN